jgi:hypothetical protein
MGYAVVVGKGPMDSAALRLEYPDWVDFHENS